MSIQNIFDSSTLIIVERTRVAGSTLSRSGRYTTGTAVSNQPFVFTVSWQPMAVYADVRSTLEEIDRLDVVYSESVDIGSTNAGLSWITAYQGDLSPAQINQITATGTQGAQTIDLDLSSVTGASAGDYVFRKNDYIQLDSGYRYPYTVTQDVLFGIGGTVTVNLNRPFIEQASYTTSGKGILVGTDVTWTVKMLNKPTYQIMPDRYVTFTGDFTFIETIED